MTKRGREKDDLPRLSPVERARVGLRTSAGFDKLQPLDESCLDASASGSEACRWKPLITWR